MGRALTGGAVAHTGEGEAGVTGEADGAVLIGEVTGTEGYG